MKRLGPLVALSLNVGSEICFQFANLKHHQNVEGTNRSSRKRQEKETTRHHNRRGAPLVHVFLDECLIF